MQVSPKMQSYIISTDNYKSNLYSSFYGILDKKGYADYNYIDMQKYLIYSQDRTLLRGKTAVITGSNRGIGKAIVESFAKNGANIFAHARKETLEFRAFLTQLSQKYNVEIYPLYFDLTDIEEVKNSTKFIRSNQPNVDILVNNAGVTLNKLFLMTTISEIQEQMDINFKATFLISQYISKLMQKHKKGSIVNISSISAVGGDCGRSLYGATKAAVSSLTKTMADELGDSGIRVNAVAPGFIDTDMMQYMTKEVIDHNLNFSKLKRIGTPQEIANVVTFLVSDLASYITGQIINVDGGIK